MRECLNDTMISSGEILHFARAWRRYRDAGHYALDENADAIAEAIVEPFS